MKKIIALLLALTLCLGLFAGCGTEKKPDPTETNAGQTNPPEDTNEPATPKDPVTITYWYGNGVGEQEYTAQVEEELNKILAATPGYEHITIDLVPCKDYSTDLTLALSSGTQVDLISTPGYGTFDKVDLGEYLELDDLVAANPEITADLPDWFVEYGKKDGNLYFIPNYQQMANTLFWGTPVEYMEKAGYTKEQVTEIIQSGDLERNIKLEQDLLQAARDLGKDAYLWGATFADPRRYTSYSNTLLSFIANSYLFYDLKDETIKWCDEDEWNLGWFGYAAQFHQDGTVYADESISMEYFGATREEYFTGDHVITSILTQGYGTSDMVSAQWSEQFGVEMFAVLANYNGEILLPAQNAAGGVAIASNTKHAEDAGKVLALLFNGKYEQFLNTLAYGIEGVHYNKIADGQVETLEFSGSQGGAETTYCYHKWRGGNTFNVWNNQSLSPEQEEYILSEINEGDASITILAGFNFDKTNVETELEQCAAVATEYRNTLGNGLKDGNWEAYYKEYIEKMELAGVRTVIEEYTNQLNAFLGK